MIIIITIIIITVKRKFLHIVQSKSLLQIVFYKNYDNRIKISLVTLQGFFTNLTKIL